MTRRRLLGLSLLGVLISTALLAEEKPSLQLTLPPVFYAAPGVEMNIYYDNIVLTETPEKYHFTVKCAIGKSEERRWTVTPGPNDVGEHKMTITVTDKNKSVLGEGKTALRVVRPDAGAGKDIRLLIVGDSLTAGGIYAAEVARLLSLPGNPSGKMLGTRKTGGKGVAHEGYGGWRWETFISKYDPNPDPDNPDPKKRKYTSPFVFVGKDGKSAGGGSANGGPEMDLPRYFKETCGGDKPDYITIMLGINDCFGACKKCDDQKAVDAVIDSMFKNAEVLLAAFRKAVPRADIGVCLTTPPNSRESGFVANYKGKGDYHRWEWKRVHHRLVQRQLEHFDKREKDRIYIIPTELNLDPVDGYPDNNGVHPNPAGYKQIGDSIYAWLKWRLQSPK